MDPAVVGRLQAGRRISAADYAAALTQRGIDQRRQHAWLADWDALLLPSTPITARACEEIDETSMILSTFTRAATYLDLPAVSVPAGLDGDGLPIGLQVLVHPERERSCLAIAGAFEQATRWHTLRPPVHADWAHAETARMR